MRDRIRKWFSFLCIIFKVRQWPLENLTNSLPDTLEGCDMLVCFFCCCFVFYCFFPFLSSSSFFLLLSSFSSFFFFFSSFFFFFFLLFLLLSSFFFFFFFFFFLLLRLCLVFFFNYCVFGTEMAMSVDQIVLKIEPVNSCTRKSPFDRSPC